MPNFDFIGRYSSSGVLYASIVSLSCVIIQNDKVIAYASRKLKVHEKNYPTHNLELDSLVFVFKMSHHYLYGIHVDVFIDHNIFQITFN